MTDALLNGDGADYVKSSQSIKRIGQTDDVADVALYLASPAARWVSGQVIEVSGGAHVSY